ncbi:hypothetical protein PP178_10520 [Zeaxanthinibacter sp. PT1]|uniref:DinB family protein n=1 Tax=Zeaxanthinibacter TaxID=561554 RepID=UPI00234925D9|nr:hypothetical protein [Zeaxanthinibacter sp. PT1]MDC6351988.1 hypothetical protein [Zeaxanthinibacter sp. PT1]
MGQTSDSTGKSYEQLPQRGEQYTAGTTLARMVDGLAFRYYWATEALTEQNYVFRAGDDLRSIEELMQHIYDLSEVVLATAQKEIVNRSEKPKAMLSIEEKRVVTLNRLEASADLFAQQSDFSGYPIRFSSEKGSSEFNFWHLINGPVSDAIWHTGQIVMLRRAAGNPIPPGVNVFLGTHSK